MASVPQTAPQPNEFELQDQTGQTKITYYRNAPGPIIQGEPVGPLLKYSGPEGALSFRGPAVEVQKTLIGEMISVNLTPQDDTGSLNFTVCLPPIVFGSNRSQDFSTFCVKAAAQGDTLQPGAQLSYETEDMRGTAKFGPQAL